MKKKTNSVLENLPGTTFQRLQPHLSFQSWDFGSLPMDLGRVETILFPVSGLVSLVMSVGGEKIDTAMIGSDGAIGLMAGLGAHLSEVSCIVRVPLTALMISAASYRTLAADDGALQKLCFQDSENLLSKTRILVAEYARSPIVARLAGTLHRAAGILQGSPIPLTQETLAQMMSVGRTSVNEAAQSLQEAGIINFARGKITILDRKSLLEAAA